MDDTISRQAAISAICSACGKIDCDKMDKCEKLQLPPANCSEFPNNSDTISRQAAIDALDKRFDDVPMELTTEILQLRRDLRELPSAQPKTGEWIIATGMMPPEFHGHHICSECCNFANMEPPFGNRESLSKFCPNCGSKMVIEDGEEE